MKFVFFAFFLLCASTGIAFESVVILPFSNESQDQHLYWLGEGFAESLSEDMYLQDAHFLTRFERKKAYDDLRLPYIGDVSRATMLKIAEKLAADYLIFGFYNQKESQLEVQTRVIKLSTSELSEPILATGPLAELFRIQTDLRKGLIKYFETQKMPEVKEKTFEGKPVPLPAYELYIKGLLEASDNDKVRFYQRAMEGNRGYQQAAYRLGLTFIRLQRYKESTDTLKKVTFSGLLQNKVEFLVALNAYFLNDYETATQKWMELLKLAPTSEVYNNIGVTMLKKGDSSGAGWYLAKAVELDPKNADYHFNLAASYVMRTYDKYAQVQYREAIRYKPWDYHSLYLLAKLFEREDSPVTKRMMQSFQESLPADQKGKFPEQYTSVAQLLRSAPSFLSVEEKQYALLAQEKESEAKATYVKSYQANARKYLDENAPDKALPEIRKGLGLDPLDWYLHHLLGRVYWEQKQLEDAVQESLLSIWCQDNVDSHLQLAEIYREGEKYADAKIQVQRTLALEPGNKRALEIWNKIWDK